MTVRIDTDIPLSSPTASPGPVGDVDSALTLAGNAGPRPYLLESTRVVIRGTERGGGGDVDIDGMRVVGSLHADTGLGVNVVASPSLLRRECVGGQGTVLETVLALPALPMAAFQWTYRDPMGLSMTVLPGQAHLRYRVHGRTLRAESPTSDLGVEILIDPEPEEWQVGALAEGGLEIRVRVPAPGPATLLVASGPPKVTARALDAGRHLGAHALRSATDQDPSNMDGLLLSTGVAELDKGVGWASFRLAGILRRGDPDTLGDWAWAGVAALAAGDATGALLAADRLRDEPAVSLVSGAQVPGPALAVLLTARATLLSGDEGPAQRVLGSLAPTTVDDILHASTPPVWAWWSLALGTLADALRYAASEDEVQALREAAARPGGAAPRTLPMIGVAAAGPEPGSASWLRALLRGEGLGAAEGRTGPEALAAWSALAGGDVDGGYTAWRATLALGLAGGESARGSWAPSGQGAASVLATLAFGLLGLEPDAPSGRIRIAPALPAHLKEFRVRGIRVGGARLELVYGRDGGAHRFHLNALDGRVPPMVVLEPSLPFPTVGAVRVDGAPAELTHVRAGGRTHLRIQIPVDGPRLLEIEEG